MGRRPEPEGVREQKAPVRSTRQGAHAHETGQVVLGTVAPPVWLKKRGLKLWHHLAPTLQSAKLLTAADAQTFGRYCRNFARWLDMQRTLDIEGETYETETYGAALEGEKIGEARPGTTLKRIHPAFAIADRLERQLLAAEDRFGLNPAERQRIMAARSQTGVSGDLFGSPKDGDQRRHDDPAARPAEPAASIEAPEGLLN